jgi:hypothetical protein
MPSMFGPRQRNQSSATTREVKLWMNAGTEPIAGQLFSAGGAIGFTFRFADLIAEGRHN